MENFNTETLFPPSQEKIEFRNKTLNDYIMSLGIENGNKIIHFGCGSRDKSFLKFIKDEQILYTGVDVNKNTIDECISITNSSNINFKEMSIQTFIDEESDNITEYDWSIVESIFDKNMYSDLQYEFIDTIIRKLLTLSNIGIAIVMDGRHTIDDDVYNTDFMSAFISSMYNRYTISRLNENQFIFCIYKYYV